MPSLRRFMEGSLASGPLLANLQVLGIDQQRIQPERRCHTCGCRAAGLDLEVAGAGHQARERHCQCGSSCHFLKLADDPPHRRLMVFECAAQVETSTFGGSLQVCVDPEVVLVRYGNRKIAQSVVHPAFKLSDASLLCGRHAWALAAVDIRLLAQ